MIELKFSEITGIIGIPPRKHPFVPEDDRVPIDEPYLPADPGDEPDDE